LNIVKVFLHVDSAGYRFCYLRCQGNCERYDHARTTFYRQASINRRQFYNYRALGLGKDFEATDTTGVRLVC